MTLKTITINASTKIASPEIRLAEVPYAGIWQYVGSCIDYTTDATSGVIRDLNHATQAAANRLSEKLSLRNISIEVVIDPMIPTTSLSFAQMVPLIQEIGENASAAVEPGPGTVVLRTWWRGGYAGVDAIGRDATVPDVIKQNLMTPGFSTKAGEWDTGFGLHSASQRAKALNGVIDFFDTEDEGPAFRFAVPVKMASSAGSPEAQVEAPESVVPEVPAAIDFNWYFPAVGDPAKVAENITEARLFKA